MRTRLLVGLLLVASVMLPPPVGPRPAYANAIVVNTTADEYGSGATCSLREAIQSANTDTAFGGCTAGSGTDTISLQAGQTYALTTRDNTQFGFNGSPVIRSAIVIEGNGATISRAGGADSFRLFHIARSGDTLAGGVVAGAGDLTLRNVTLSGGLAQGGDGGSGRYGGGGGAGLGGAIFVRGTLAIERSTLQGNTAQGGNGGTSDAARTGSGGGGGIGRRGGDGSTSPGVGGGGGGGFGGTGGDGAIGNNGGGEGGGIVANGTNGSGPTGGSGGSPEGGDGRSLHSQSGGFGGGGGGSTGGVSSEGGNGGIGGGGGGAGFQAYSGGFGGGGGGAGSYGGPGGFGGGGGGATSNGAGGVAGGAGGSSGSTAGGGGGGGVGGALFNDGGTITVTNSTLSGNAAIGGAGGNGTVAGGAGQGLGGAVFTLNGTTTVLASTIASNTAAHGAAYEFRVDDGGTVNSTVSRSIVANSVGPADCRGTRDSGTLTRAGADNLVEVNDPDTGCSGAVSSADPLLQPLAVVAPGQTAVHALSSGSPAVDAVAGSCPESTDQRGVSRPVDGDSNGVARCDIGAFERPAGGSQSESNLGITKTDGRTVIGAGQTTIYTIVVSNAGPSTATNARVQDSFPAAVTSVSWTCSPSVGSSCPGSGTGNIDTLVTLPSGGQVTFSATATIANNASGSLANTASVTPPAGITDPNLADNSATDTDTIANCSARPPVHVTTVKGGGTLTVTLTAGVGAISSVQFGDGVQHPGVPTNAAIAVISPGGGPKEITGAQTYTPPAGTSSVALRILRLAAGRLVVPLVVSDACGAWRTFVGAGAGLSL